MVIIYCDIVAFSLTSGIHAKTLRVILKVKTSRHIFRLRVHRTLSNIAIFRKLELKKARHKEDLTSCFIRRFFFFFAAKFGLCPFIKNTARLICTALLAPNGNCLDITTIYLCFFI